VPRAPARGAPQDFVRFAKGNGPAFRLKISIYCIVQTLPILNTTESSSNFVFHPLFWYKYLILKNPNYPFTG
jgi:hypothetical protein